MSAKFVALDIGNVCLEIHPERCLEYFKLPEIPMELLAVLGELECGRLDTGGLLHCFRQLLPAGYSDEQLMHGWNLAVGEEIAGIEAVVRRLTEQGCRVIFFSDTSEIHLEKVFRQLSFTGLIAGGVYSFEVGARKPQPQMYEAFERRFGKPVLYVDDRACNIAAARERGWNAWQFSSAAELEQQLSGGGF